MNSHYSQFMRATATLGDSYAMDTEVVTRMSVTLTVTRRPI